MHNRNILLVLTLVLSFITIGCNHDMTKSQEFLDVMEIHDIAMAEMGNIHKTSKALTSSLANSSSNQDSLLIQNLIDDLANAEDGMMNWMANFSLPEDNKLAKEYLKQEMVSVQKVHDDIFRALEGAHKNLKP